MIWGVAGDGNGQEGPTSTLSGCSNSNQARDINSSSSTRGYATLFRGLLVGWPSSKQKYASASRLEYEYIILSESFENIQYYLRVLKNFPEALGQIILYKDDQLCILWDTEKDNRNKRLDVQYHVCRKAVCNRKVRIKYCSSLEMMADTQEKVLGPRKFNTVKDLIPMIV